MDRAVLEKRMKMLNNYLQIIVQPGVVSSHPGLMQMLLSFFEPGEYDKRESGGQISRTVSFSYVICIFCSINMSKSVTFMHHSVS